MDWMTFHLPIMLGFLLVFAQAGRAAAAPPGQRPDPTLERIIALVETQFDNHIHVLSALLINAGSRSGKETIAYGVKKLRLAKLIGENTAGALVAGGPFCLPDGALLYLAALKVRIDGEVLEGKGVAPDIAVPFDIRYAAGRDLQLLAALDFLASAAVAN